MEILPANALSEYRTSIHNDETWYNYSLILSSFFDDLGLGKDTVQPLREKLAFLEARDKRIDFENVTKERKEVRELKAKILEIQADIFITKVKKDLQWGFDAIKSRQ